MKCRWLILLCALGCGKAATIPTGHVTGFEPYDAPAFTLTERSGKTVSKSDLTGSVWIASFVFTRCNGPCPTVTASMARLQSELLPTRPDVRLVTFTVDPARDKPDDLKKYAANFRADPEKWLFLTGDEKTLHDLLIKGFQVAAFAKPMPIPGDEFDHTTKLLVIDKQGRIRGLFDGMKADWDTDGSMFDEDQRKLQSLVDRLRAES